MAVKTLSAATFFAVSLSHGAFAEAYVDQLTGEQTAVIQAAYDRVLSDPEAGVDQLSLMRMRAILATYETHDPDPATDVLSNTHWITIHTAYATHDPERTVLTDASQY